MVPKIIHQIWWQGSTNIPKDYPNYIHTWKNKNKNFKYMFWDEHNIRTLLKEYPMYIKRFNTLPMMIQKIDMAKYIILHKYGGILVDVDSECLHPIEPLLKNKKVGLVKINGDPIEKYLAYRKFMGLKLQNGFIIGDRNHSFFLHVLNLINQRNITYYLSDNMLSYVFRTTGPLLLTDAYNSYPYKNDISIIDGSIIDPVSWCDYEYLKCSDKSCGKYFPKAYSLHHYGSKYHSGWVKGLDMNFAMTWCKHGKKSYLYLITLIIIIIVIILLEWRK
jgi:hypothetical protein